jgi:hypothetical protein
MQSRKKLRIPQFKSYEDEVAFWETHDTTEFEDEWVEVELKVARPLVHVLEVELDAKTIDALVEVGRPLGIGPAALAAAWITERLASEHGSNDASPSKQERET